MLLKTFSSILLLLLNAANTNALEVLHTRDSPHIACAFILSSVVQFTKSSFDGIQNFCDVNNQAALGSMAHCLVDSFTDSSEEFVFAFLESCHAFNLTENQFVKSYLNATDFLVDAMSITNVGSPFFLPVELPKKIVLEANNVVNKASLSSNNSIWFGIILVSYWLVVMLIGAIHHWLYFLFPNLIKSLHGPLSNTLRRCIILPPTFSNHHAEKLVWFNVFQGMVPLRFESLIILGWTALVSLFTAITIAAPIGGSVIEAVGYRSGIMSIFCIPLLLLFSGRNNIMQWVTGWTFSRFLLFHRWISRVVFSMILVHATTKSIVALTAIRGLSFYKWGVVGVVSSSLLIFHSAQIFRHMNYEVFILMHIILSVIFLVATWKHTSSSDLGSPGFLYCCFAVWGFDRLIRLIRLATFGVQKATVELRADETLRVTINRPSYWIPHPGAHAFIHFLKPTYFWQSHPFTLVDSILEPNTITFYMKVKGGITHGLYKHLNECQGKQDKFNVLVEGPYSQRLPLRKFDKIVFLAGGTGIPGLYYESFDLSRAAKSENKTIKLYWVIRHFKSIDWFYEELLKLKETGIKVIIYITNPQEDMESASASMTGREFKEMNNSSSDNEKNPFQDVNLEEHKETSNNFKPPSIQSNNYMFFTTIINNLNFVEFRYGRPDISEIVQRETVESSKSIAFATCAHPSIVDHARVAVAEELKRDFTKRIELFEEIQGW